MTRLVVFGGTGDLTGRYLLPGLAALFDTGHLDEHFRLICADMKEWDDARFHDWVADRLDRHAANFSPAARASVAAAARYRQADIRNPREVAGAIAGDGPLVVYLALPPALFPLALDTLGAAGLPAGSRLVLEKPFGEDLASAEALNRRLADLLPEQSVFRVDHFLAMTTVQNVLGSRLANRVFESVWNSTHIEKVEIVWDETLTLEDRAGYYDTVGALEDMVQNHLLQLLCLIAMEPPITLSERDLRDRKVDVLRSIHTLTDDDIRRCTRRARYSAGTIGDRQVPSYRDERGVDPSRGTETFTEIDLTIDNWRWSGTTFTMRTGKALGADHKEVAVHFRPVPQRPFRPDTTTPNVLRFGLEPESLTLALTVVGAAVDALVPLTMTTPVQPSDLPAYGRLLLNVLNGDPALSIRADEAEQAWRVVTPVISAWSRGVVPLEEYPAGSSGPDDHLPEPARDEPH
ncbi:glucose-6-phosphate dehydrogenase [Nocardia vermiculata]|uniref:Glucose-6-phosphate 1-dehydrogenase n=1 Tax=Nocardia vermiculata TaxID=257274 RepID=A0A846XW74_9NOCA|nr:glucose-6-phosphate dehydrogenase [Nocardia vermiculata]NKY49641.1 glucose-6-phosphate dehydrogenase [Nocardia vermiculata]